jgi:predicted nucleotidyltransferase
MKLKGNKSIQIEESDYKILMDILKRYPYKFYVYGSRAKGNARRYSDIDIFCKEKMKEGDLVNLEMDLDESNLTIKVDILDSEHCSLEFMEAIKKDLIEIKQT